MIFFQPRNPFIETSVLWSNPIMTANTATLTELEALLQGCREGHRKSQELLYRQFYGYAMSVCLRYTRSRDEAIEVLNDGFMKVFTKTEKYDPERSFKGWLRRIMINTALDYYRQQVKHYFHEDVEMAAHTSTNETVIGTLAHEELIRLVQRLTPAYRMVFNMYVIDGYSHEEIAEQLEISVGTSKSNLARAREQLRNMLKQEGYDKYE